VNDDRLPLHLKLIYGLGDHSVNVALVALTAIFPFYLTDVVGMRIGIAGLVPLIGRGVDALTDVWMGRISDRTTWKAGRRRPYLLIGAVPFSLSFAAIWSSPSIENSTLEFGFYVGIYVLLSISMTIVAVPYQALLPELTSNYHERTSLATFRSISSIFGTFVTLMLFRKIVTAFGGDANAWSMAGIVFGLWILWPWFPIWWVTYERTGKRSESNVSTREYFKLLAENRTFRRLIALFSLGRMAIDLPMALFLYYFTYVIGRPEDFEPVMAVFLISVIVAMPVWLRFSRGRDKNTVYLCGCVGWIFGLSCLFVNQPEWPLVITLIATGFAGVGYSAADMIPWSMVADIADEDEILSGERREGLYVGVFTFLRKLAGALGVALAFLALDVVGFEPGVENSDSVLWVLRAATALVPVLFVIASGWAARSYPLGRLRHQEILEELERRRLATVSPDSADRNSGTVDV
jgi:sugar (glycoside-pentoside-hexuronide) transporter